MYLSRIKINNFRNFKELDVALAGNIVCVGENRVGKSNLLYALRLIFDPSLPDNARQLTLSDFWDGIGTPGAADSISVSVEIKEFESDVDILSVLTDYRLNDDPKIVRLNYQFRPKAGLTGSPGSEEDYEFICFGGQSENKRFGHELRRRLTMDVLSALRDAEGDLSAWRKSPLRPLIESAFSGIDRDELTEIKEAIEAATESLTDFETIKTLEDDLGKRFAAMSGPKQDVKPRFGFGATDVSQVFRNIRLLIDEGRRTIGDASLGSANILFLTLKALDLKRLIDENKRDHTLFAIEEPEAHLHPHLQRSVYRHLFEDFGYKEEESPLSIILTTHSPHIASIAPLRSILLLKDIGDGGTVGYSTATIELTKTDIEDLTRYLDVTRAELLFARGIILVEGDAEKFLLPTFAETMGHPLDHFGITVCSVAGTNFIPYVKLLTSLNIPYSVITDWDPVEGKTALAMKRAARLVLVSENIRTGKLPVDLKTQFKDFISEDAETGLSALCDQYGVFTNNYTLEVDLFNAGFKREIIDTLREHNFSSERMTLIDKWESEPEKLDEDKYLSLIEVIGKGRFAQRLASRVKGKKAPAYIRHAIKYVIDRV